MGFFTDDRNFRVIERHLFAPDRVVLDEVTMDEAKQFVRDKNDGQDYVIKHV